MDEWSVYVSETQKFCHLRLDYIVAVEKRDLFRTNNKKRKRKDGQNDTNQPRDPIVFRVNHERDAEPNDRATEKNATGFPHATHSINHLLTSAWKY